MIDHLVLAVPDLVAAMDRIESDWGVRPAMGGKHVGRGTHNALLSLGDGPYLELIAQDPEQEPGAASARFGVDQLTGPLLRTWAMKAPDIEALVARARAAGYDPGDISAMSRALPGGGLLEWKLTSKAGLAGVLPFLIDWGNSPHPSRTSPAGCTLVSLTIEHPDPAEIRRALAALEIDVPVFEGPEPRLHAEIATPNGLKSL